jgi:hypothetical protein
MLIARKVSPYNNDSTYKTNRGRREEMKPTHKRLAALAPLAMAALLSMSIAPAATPGASAAPYAIPGNFADPAFQSLWTRTDQLVDEGKVKRSYYWGPLPGFTAYEEYAEGPNGKHLVQYFDKSRMEINNPNGDKNNPFYVTNGLLTLELISGRIQIGNTKYQDRYPAELNIASDGDDTGAGTPTYASFRSVASSYNTSNSRIGETIVDTINRLGLVGSNTAFSNYNVKYSYYEPATKHNIPDVFWTFLNASGPVMKDGKTVDARLSDPYFYATGYPLADAYWASVKIAGKTNTAVLIQPYERRVLTFVPDAPEGFKVQMGNIGQHYYAWRYSEAGKPKPPEPQCHRVPIRGFGKVWADHSDVRSWLGCTYEAERALTVAQQYFQHGQMIDIIGNYDYYGSSFKQIFVLFDDGTTQAFADNFVDGSAEPNIQAPAGLYAPVRGFGKVWREGTGARVRERLGWATAPETVAVAPLPYMPPPYPTVGPTGPTPTPVPPGNGGAFQRFDRGMMVYAGPVLKKIYILYNEFGYGYYDISRWAVFDDTYSDP